MTDRTLSGQFLHHFVETINSELGQENLSIVLEKASLPSDWSDPTHWKNLKGAAAAEAYAVSAL